MKAYQNTIFYSIGLIEEYNCVNPLGVVRNCVADVEGRIYSVEVAEKLPEKVSEDMAWAILMFIPLKSLSSTSSPILYAPTAAAERKPPCFIVSRQQPFARTSTRQKRAFAVAGPSIWNGLPLSIRSLPRTLSQTFLSPLKAVLFGRVGVGGASE